MPLHPNNELLRQTLEALPLLHGRFSNIKLANFSEVTGKKRGCFSMVFSAFDEIESKRVALKFYDQDPARKIDTYRIAAFKREHEILQSLLNVERCLQLASALNTFVLEYDVQGVKGVALNCDYFAVDWLDQELDDYFLLANADMRAVDKLRLFKEMVLAVEALHNHEVFHRDLKADNLRAYQTAVKRIVVAIDLGTAARFDSGCIGSNYSHSVGARGYAPPESICGLAGNRHLAPYADVYALGCMLYELFNPGYLYGAMRTLNARFDIRLSAMGSMLTGTQNPVSQVDEWRGSLARYGGGVSSVKIDCVGSTVPKGVAPVLNDLLRALTHINYSQRLPSFEWVRRKILSSIKTLENEAAYQAKLIRSREERKRRTEVLAQKSARLSAHIAGGLLNANAKAP